MSTQTTENYLKAIYSLTQKQEKVSLTDVSNSLNISAATANNMMQKLKKSGWIKQEKYQPIRLTKAGSLKASMIIRKHRITEMYLHQFMGIGWEDVHSIAEEMEHIKSPILFDRMDELLNFPKYDPHGSPIPNKSGEIVEMDYHLLSQTPIGTKVKLVGIEDGSKELLQFLNQKKIGLGTQLEVMEVIKFDKSCLIKIEGTKELTLSSKVCNTLKVCEIDEEL